MNIKNVKFLKKGVKDSAGNYYPCWYSLCTLIDGKVAITIYAKSYSKGLPKELSPENDTDTMTDYFDSDKVRFYEGSPEFELVKPLARKDQ